MENRNDDVDDDYKDVHCTLQRRDHCRTLRTISVAGQLRKGNKNKKNHFLLFFFLQDAQENYSVAGQLRKRNKNLFLIFYFCRTLRTITVLLVR